MENDHEDKKVLTDLIARLKRNSIASLKSEKPEDFEAIVRLTERFLVSQSKAWMANSFGNMTGPELEDSNDQFFDPLEEYRKEPDNLEEICLYLQHDMNEREHELIELSHGNKSTYNMVVFGAAIKLAQGENISSELREFLINHLIGEQPKFKRGKGRPKASSDSKRFALYAIEFARSFGLSATRYGDERSDTACDAVEKAANNLIASGAIKSLPIQYTYRNLVHIWNDRKELSG